MLQKHQQQLVRKGKNLFARIKNMGKFNHNVKVVASGEGEMIVCRRPGKTLTSEYLPCIHCFGFYRSIELWRHCQKCPFNTSTHGQKQSGTIARAKLLLQGGILSENLATVTEENNQTSQIKLDIQMRQDDVYDQVKDDGLIKQFGQILSDKLGPRRNHDAALRMRQLGRLKIALNESCGEHNDLTHYIIPNHFDKVMKSVQELAKLQTSSEGIKNFQTPSLALRLGHNLLKCAEIKQGIAIRSVDNETQRSVKNFIQLHRAEWADKVSSIAHASLRTSKFNTPTILPLTEDLVTLKHYLDAQLNELSSKLEEQKRGHIYRTLEEVVMARIIIFNKRR